MKTADESGSDSTRDLNIAKSAIFDNDAKVIVPKNAATS